MHKCSKNTHTLFLCISASIIRASNPAWLLTKKQNQLAGSCNQEFSDSQTEHDMTKTESQANWLDLVSRFPRNAWFQRVNFSGSGPDLTGLCLHRLMVPERFRVTQADC